MRMTKKSLKELAASLQAFKCKGNVYDHENLRFYVEIKDFEKIKEYSPNLHEFLIDFLVGNCKICCYGIVSYSVGLYGNTGQIFQYKIFNEDNEIIREFYTFYC